MEKLVIKGRYFGSSTTAVKNEEGDWEVTCDMVERRLIEGATEWEEKVLATKCTDKDFNNAYGVAMNATLEKFAKHVEETKSDSMFGLENIFIPEESEKIQ